MSDLNDVVDALTLPTRTKVIQGDDVTVVVHDPLLQQLADAVTSAIGNGGGGGSATGSVLNDEALYRAAIISTQIGDWCRKVGVVPSRVMVADLRSWYAIHIGRLEGDGFYTHKLQDWVALITDLLDPPKRVPLVGACVICGADTWPDADGAQLLFPLMVSFRQDDPFGTAEAKCRACEAVWESAQAVSELVEEMDEKEKSA